MHGAHAVRINATFWVPNVMCCLVIISMSEVTGETERVADRNKVNRSLCRTAAL